MQVIAAIAGIAIIALVLVDGFESIVQTRHVTRRYRYTRFFYRTNWSVWRWLALRFPAGRRRDDQLDRFGPISLLALLASWVVGLIFGFALVNWAFRTLHAATADPLGFGTYVYASGEAFFTLGYTAIVPNTPAGRALTVVEAGVGFGFLAIVISYLPVLYQAFSRREAPISLLDARAGSPPSAAQFLLRLGPGNLEALDRILAEWERWAAELLEGLISYPVLAYYRSQHDNQSWLAALTAILDTCTLLIVQVKTDHLFQAQLTFAIARHAAVDAALVLKVRPCTPAPERLPPAQLSQLQERLRAAGIQLVDSPDAASKLAQVRAMYEPFVCGLAERFLFKLPLIVPLEDTADNWQRSAWMPRAPGIGSLPRATIPGDHF